MQSSYRNRKKRKLKADINVVPYIDVMLVLLIIFMVTAPLLNLGVDIHLPQSAAKAIQNDKGPALVSVDKDGKMYLTPAGGTRSGIEPDALVKVMGVAVKENAQLQVLIAADERVEYGKVYQAMALLQQAGVVKIGMMSQPLQETRTP